uniref:Reverse transcriptase domain-containing protein n=1 Tax=Moniliophthora roreri TaxID=221103 RepID=A0A0W0F6W8_MONRR
MQKVMIEEVEDEDKTRRKKRNQMRANLVGGSNAPPSRGVSCSNPQPEPSHRTDNETPETVPVCVLDSSVEIDQTNPSHDLIPEGMDTDGKPNIFTRNDGPEGAFRRERIQELLKQIKIGNDLTPVQKQRVTNLITTYADCFALSVGEVRHVPGAVHKLNIPDNATFSKKVRQKPLTPAQQAYLHEKIDELVAAGVLEQCNPSEVKCVSPLTMAKKAHEHGGLTIEELKHRVNDQCIAAGLNPAFEGLPERNEVTTSEHTSEKPTPKQKWRICQNFAEVNRVTEITPMPQGDIRAKQQALSGHRWLNLIDFASGFYAVDIDPESRPYTAFYVEGKGYFQCAKMPFGLTGAPSTFAHMTATHLHDFIADGTLELFVDDGGSGMDEFEEGIEKSEKIFKRVRERNLSLSASKSEFFVTEGIFAGGKVGPNGVTTDPAKLTAIESLVTSAI